MRTVKWSSIMPPRKRGGIRNRTDKFRPSDVKRVRLPKRST